MITKGRDGFSLYKHTAHPVLVGSAMECADSAVIKSLVVCLCGHGRSLLVHSQRATKDKGNQLHESLLLLHVILDQHIILCTCMYMLVFSIKKKGGRESKREREREEICGCYQYNADMNGRVCGALVEFGCYLHRHE